MANARGLKSTQITVVPLKGGLNRTAATLEIVPGEARELYNYEVTPVGQYQRVEGYQRRDGRVLPHLPSFYAVTVDDTTGYAAGDTITGDTSGATARVVDLDATTNTLAVVDITGVFIADETLDSATVTMAGTPQENYVESPDLLIQYTLAKEQYYRDLIGPVPGSGPVRGVTTYLGTGYAFRDAADGLSCAMYKTSASGWTLVTTPTLDPGGQYRMIEANFEGATASKVLCGVDGVNPAFVFDGTTFTQLSTGVTPDAPVALEALPSSILVLGYASGALITSALNDPTDYDGANGASEIAVGDEIMHLQVQPNRALAVFCRTRLYLLYGTSPADFELTRFASRLAYKANTGQALGDTVFFTDAGIRRLQRSDQFGDFQDLDLSLKVQDLVADYADRAAFSYTVSTKNQYRVGFDDKTGLCLTFLGQEVLGVSSFAYPVQMHCAASGLDADNTEVTLLGGEDGYVYQAEAGYNHDGVPIASVMRTSFMFPARPEYRNRIKKVLIEVDADQFADLQLRIDLDYASGDAPTTPVYRDLAAYAGGLWDSAKWDRVYWAQDAVWLGEVYTTGVARNVSVIARAESATQHPHTLQNLIFHWTPRGRRR